MSTLRVLIVEDNADGADSLRLVLALHEIDAEVVGTLAEALLRLRADGIDCAIADLSLPDTSGVGAVARLQADYPEVPVVVYTGHPSLGIPALHAGAQEVLLKPADPEAVVRAVHYATARHEVRKKYEPHTAALDRAVRKVDEQLEGGTPT